MRYPRITHITVYMSEAITWMTTFDWDFGAETGTKTRDRLDKLVAKISYA